jgi:hypothetical protein
VVAFLLVASVLRASRAGAVARAGGVARPLVRPVRPPQGVALTSYGKFRQQGHRSRSRLGETQPELRRLDGKLAFLGMLRKLSDIRVTALAGKAPCRMMAV